MFEHLPAVLFDLDGTLVDSSPDLAAALNHVLEQDSLPPATLAEVQRMLGDGAPALLEKAYGRHGRPLPAAALERFRRRYERHCLDATRPYDGIPELLALLSTDREVAVVTNKPTDFARRVVDGLGLAPFVRAVLGPECVPRAKPAPEHVLAALAGLGREPHEAVMVGDSTHDVLAGRRAGTATIALVWGFRERQ